MIPCETCEYFKTENHWGKRFLCTNPNLKDGPTIITPKYQTAENYDQHEVRMFYEMVMCTGYRPLADWK